MTAGKPQVDLAEVPYRSFIARPGSSVCVREADQ